MFEPLSQYPAILGHEVIGRVTAVGHFALDTKADKIAALVREFMKTQK